MKYHINHLGGEQGVTGACHLLQMKGAQIMVDCGLNQGADRLTPMSQWPVRPADIDYLFLTHAHLDHVGRLPDLIEAGFKGEVLCTHPTKALLMPLLSDALDFRALSQKEKGRILQSIKRISWGFEYGQRFELAQGIAFRFGNAGHILGSSFILFESQHPHWSIVFSGDIGATHTPIIPDPDPVPQCNFLVLESTYGDRLHEDRRTRIQRLGQALTNALGDGGKVYIPSFALGRTQELLYEMDRLFTEPKYDKLFPELAAGPKIPVFIDSPLGITITSIYSKYHSYWNRKSKHLKAKGDHPFDFKHLFAVKSHHEHQRLLEISGPAVIIAGSGMCTGGRIVNHFEKGLSDPRNDILMVGYQGKGTPGRQLIDISRSNGGHVRLNGKKIKVEAKIKVMGGYSAHADQADLMNWVASMPGCPGKIKLVHGESDAKDKLAVSLQRRGYQVV
jgi:metallo-beta-lactamase family protein